VYPVSSAVMNLCGGGFQDRFLLAFGGRHISIHGLASAAATVT